MGLCVGGQKCQRVHAPKEDITDNFASSVIQLTCRGFEYLTSTYDSGGGTKRKAGGRWLSADRSALRRYGRERYNLSTTMMDEEDEGDSEDEDVDMPSLLPTA